MITKDTVDNEALKTVRDQLKQSTDSPIRAWMIRDALKQKFGVEMDEATIRVKFVEMKEPLSAGVIGSGKPKEAAKLETNTKRKHINDTSAIKAFQIPNDMMPFIPAKEEFAEYVERDVDKRLAVHYNTVKYPLTQGKQGTGKTFSHKYYAFRNSLPFFLISGHEDMKLPKLFGDKTIMNGSVVYQESLLVKAIQCPSVILFDEINAVSNSNTFDFHALLQNRELYVKDANDGKGRIYQLHPDCRIGFAQNPKSAKYIGGCVKPSNFLGRCTFITYPEFSKKQVETILSRRYPSVDRKDIKKFTQFYFAVSEVIERNQLPVDVSIRQINNVVDFWISGLPLKHAIEDGLSSILEAASQPKAKESFETVGKAVWCELQ